MKFQVGLIMLSAVLAGGCGTPKVNPNADSEISRVAGLARKSFERGTSEQAANLYLRALERARATDNAAEIGNNAYNLAVCLIALGEHDRAREVLSEAKREFERIGRPVADILILEAKSARAVGRYDEALALADQVIPSLKSDTDASYRFQVALLKTQVACDRGDMTSAKKEFAVAQKEIKDVEDPYLQAGAAGISGRILLLDREAGKAASEFDKEADLCRTAEKYHDMGLALGRAGQAYLDAGILLPASDRFYRSARSLYAQQDLPGALKMIQPALDAAKVAGDDETLRRVITLFKDIKKDVEYSKPPPEELKKVVPADAGAEPVAPVP